jgi:ElaB/YqjD/DUF883 family membrane-anchored ribosome-binding protein
MRRFRAGGAVAGAAIPLLGRAGRACYESEAMSDVFVEDDDPGLEPRALARLRGEVSRAANALERRLHNSASMAVEDARLMMRRVESRIHARPGTAAIVAVATGVALGLLVAMLSSSRRR